VFVTVSGTEQYRADVKSVRMQSSDPLKLEVAVANYGNVHLRATGFCVIRAGDTGEELMRFPVNAQRFPLYPGATNTLYANAVQELPPGNYVCAVELPFPDEEHMVSNAFELSVPEAAE